MADFEVEIEGFDDLIKNLEKIGEQSGSGGRSSLFESAAMALYDEAQEIRVDSMEHTPVDTGALRASHTVSAPEIGDGEVSVTIGVGGPAADYAVYVHENLEAHHEVGEAKFLEHALQRAAHGFVERIGQRLVLYRGGGTARGGNGGGGNAPA